jgi:hypothetical protein
MIDLTTQKDRLKSLGLNDEKVQEVLDLATQEVADSIMVDFAPVASDEEATEFESRIQNSKSGDHFITIIEEMAVKAYGDEAENKISTLYSEFLNPLIDAGSSFEETYKKYTAGDPDTVKAVGDKLGTEEADQFNQVISGQDN